MKIEVLLAIYLECFVLMAFSLIYFPENLGVYLVVFLTFRLKDVLRKKKDISIINIIISFD